MTLKKSKVVLRYMGGSVEGVPERDLAQPDIDTVAHERKEHPSRSKSFLIGTGVYAIAPDIDAALGRKEE